MPQISQRAMREWRRIARETNSDLSVIDNEVTLTPRDPFRTKVKVREPNPDSRVLTYKFRLNKAEMDTLLHNAMISGMDVSAYIRHMCCTAE